MHWYVEIHIYYNVQYTTKLPKKTNHMQLTLERTIITKTVVKKVTRLVQKHHKVTPSQLQWRALKFISKYIISLITRQENK